MRNKDGFTLVEVIISIILLLLLATLILPNIIDMGDKSRNKMYESKITYVLSGAYKYGVENIDLLGEECFLITVGELISLEYLNGDDGDLLINPVNGKSLNNESICIYFSNNEVRTKMKN